MPKKIEERLNILSPYRGFISPINMMGPIVHPLPVEKSKVAQIIASGAKVYEYIPTTGGTIELTLSSLNNSNRHNAINLQENVKAEEKRIPTPVEPVIKVGVPNVEIPVETVKEPVIEESSVEEVVNETAEITEEVVEETEEVPEEKSAEKELITFQYNEDGTVNESVIEWNNYSKNERKTIRALINKHNESLGINE
jgi:hypothetical protein